MAGPCAGNGGGGALVSQRRMADGGQEEVRGVPAPNGPGHNGPKTLGARELLSGSSILPGPGGGGVFDFPLILGKAQVAPPPSRGGRGVCSFGWVGGLRVAWPPSSVLQLQGLHSLQVPSCLLAFMSFGKDGDRPSSVTPRVYGCVGVWVGGSAKIQGSVQGQCKLPPQFCLTSQHLLGGGGGSDPPPPPTSDPPHPTPPAPVSDWANVSPGLRPIKQFFWRLRHKSV